MHSSRPPRGGSSPAALPALLRASTFSESGAETLVSGAPGRAAIPIAALHLFEEAGHVENDIGALGRQAPYCDASIGSKANDPVVRPSNPCFEAKKVRRWRRITSGVRLKAPETPRPNVAGYLLTADRP
jgi:hypothetical protein